MSTAMPKILIVDDDEMIRTMFGECLDGQGYGTQLAADSVEALEYLNKYSYELVLTDINMPRMNGVQLLHNARKITASRTVYLVMTGSAEKKSQMAAIAAGASGVFVKPFSITNLFNSIEQILL